MAYLLIALAIVFRLVKHIPNFAPIGAVALFSGVYLKNKWALALPLAAMVISDYFIGYYTLPVMLAVYSSFALIGVIGRYVGKNKNLYTIVGGCLTGSVLFYLITNFAVWAATPYYAKTLTGIVQCYVNALPFFRYTVAGDIFFSTVLFGSYEAALAFQRKKELQKASV